jgi:hypothetical protein
LALKCVLSIQYARASNEVDQTGSGRNAFVAEEANRLGEQALINLRELSEITAQFQRRRDYCSAGARAADLPDSGPSRPSHRGRE